MHSLNNIRNRYNILWVSICSWTSYSMCGSLARPQIEPKIFFYCRWLITRRYHLQGHFFFTIKQKSTMILSLKIIRSGFFSRPYNIFNISLLVFRTFYKNISTFDYQNRNRPFRKIIISLDFFGSMFWNGRRGVSLIIEKKNFINSSSLRLKNSST